MNQRAKRLSLVALGVGLLFLTATVSLAQSGSPTVTPAAQKTKAAATPTATANHSAADEARPAGWREASHSNDVDPNYAVVFPVDQVNQLTITISAENWAAMQANMTELFGERSARAERGGFGPPQPRSPLAGPAQPPSPLAGGRPAGQPPSPLVGGAPLTATVTATGPRNPAFGGPPNGGMGGPGGVGGDFTTENPMWVTATIDFAGETWTNVGVRYKGNSSLRSAWHNNTLKLPFKLDFDEFEDSYPAIKNQRFYGFKQLSLANNLQDGSYLRDALTYDLLDAAGLVAAETAFYELILDYGEGPTSLGVYTMVEVIDDTVIGRYFADDNGNIYEGDGRAASFAKETFAQIETSFQKENNEDEADWSDVEALYTLLHSEARLADPDGWRADLAALFDVDTFLEWLAISAVIEHWDTYGAMTHNYYLYHDPDSDLLTWISWDHNLVLGASGGGILEGNNRGNQPPRGNFGPAGGGPRPNTALDKADVDENWPLIRYLLDDPVYYEQYVAELAATLDDLFIPAELTAQVEAYAALLAPYAAAEEGAAEFDAAVQALIDRIESRYETVEAFLADQ